MEKRNELVRKVDLHMLTIINFFFWYLDLHRKQVESKYFASICILLQKGHWLQQWIWTWRLEFARQSETV